MLRVLCGGLTRELQSELFALHREGLLAQSSSSLTTDAAHLTSFHVEVRHNSVPDNEGPRWNHAKIARVAKVRQAFLNDAFFYQGSDQPRMNYAGVFMVDTDVIVGPGVLARMWSVEADVVYGVFSTEADWLDGSRICPQVWNVHPYQFTDQVWEALNMPGVHEIDVLGGGACTLIRGRGFESAYWPLLESLKYSSGIQTALVASINHLQTPLFSAAWTLCCSCWATQTELNDRGAPPIQNSFSGYDNRTRNN